MPTELELIAEFHFMFWSSFLFCLSCFLLALAIPILFNLFRKRIKNSPYKGFYLIIQIIERYELINFRFPSSFAGVIVFSFICMIA